MQQNSEVDVNVLVKIYHQKLANALNQNVLLEAKLTTGNSHVMLAVRSGKAIRFEESKTRPMGRGASGVRGTRKSEVLPLRPFIFSPGMVQMSPSISSRWACLTGWLRRRVNISNRSANCGRDLSSSDR